MCTTDAHVHISCTASSELYTHAEASLTDNRRQARVHELSAFRNTLPSRRSRSRDTVYTSDTHTYTHDRQKYIHISIQAYKNARVSTSALMSCASAEAVLVGPASTSTPLAVEAMSKCCVWTHTDTHTDVTMLCLVTHGHTHRCHDAVSGHTRTHTRISRSYVGSAESSIKICVNMHTHK